MLECAFEQSKLAGEEEGKARNVEIRLNTCTASVNKASSFMSSASLAVVSAAL